MPDVATTRDTARKLEQWRDTLAPAEREEVTSWMRAGVPDDRRRWWHEPAAERDRPPA